MKHPQDRQREERPSACLTRAVPNQPPGLGKAVKPSELGQRCHSGPSCRPAAIQRERTGSLGCFSEASGQLCTHPTCPTFNPDPGKGRQEEGEACEEAGVGAGGQSQSSSEGVKAGLPENLTWLAPTQRLQPQISSPPFHMGARAHTHTHSRTHCTRMHTASIWGTISGGVGGGGSELPSLTLPFMNGRGLGPRPPPRSV